MSVDTVTDDVAASDTGQPVVIMSEDDANDPSGSGGSTIAFGNASRSKWCADDWVSVVTATVIMSEDDGDDADDVEFEEVAVTTDTQSSAHHFDRRHRRRRLRS
jgi:hypothetical protein